MLWRNSRNGSGIFHFWHVQDRNTLAALRFVQWTNRLYVQSNFTLEYRLYLWLGFVASPPLDLDRNVCQRLDGKTHFSEKFIRTFRNKM